MIDALIQAMLNRSLYQSVIALPALNGGALQSICLFMAGIFQISPAKS